MSGRVQKNQASSFMQPLVIKLMSLVTLATRFPAQD